MYQTTPGPERVFSKKLLDNWCWREIMWRHWALEKMQSSQCRSEGSQEESLLSMPETLDSLPSTTRKRASTMRKTKIMKCAWKWHSVHHPGWMAADEILMNWDVLQGENVIQSTIGYIDVERLKYWTWVCSPVNLNCICQGRVVFHYLEILRHRWPRGGCFALARSECEQEE